MYKKSIGRTLAIWCQKWPLSPYQEAVKKAGAMKKLDILHPQPLKKNAKNYKQGRQKLSFRFINTIFKLL